jgi:hypothetical protein
MAVTQSSTSERLTRNQLGLFGVIMPGVAQVAPAFNLLVTTGLMVSLAGASAPLIFLIAMVGMAATASSLAQFSGVYPSAGSFITYITRAIGTKVAVAVGVICVLGYIIAFGGIYIFVGSYIVENVFNNVHFWGVTQLVTILYGVLVVLPVVVDLNFGVRVTVGVYVFDGAAARLPHHPPRAARAAFPAPRSPGRAARRATCCSLSASPCWRSADSRRPHRSPRRPATRAAQCRSPCSAASWSAASSTSWAPTPW